MLQRQYTASTPTHITMLDNPVTNYWIVTAAHMTSMMIRESNICNMPLLCMGTGDTYVGRLNHGSEGMQANLGHHRMISSEEVTYSEEDQQLDMQKHR